MDVGPREIAALLRGAQIAECPCCKDFNLPPAPAIAPHKIDGSALEDMLEVHLADRGSPGKNEIERT